MYRSEMRRIAIGAIRSEARRQSFDLKQLDAEAALRMLDDLYRAEPALIASIWYKMATDNQIKLFKREWNDGKVF